MMSKCFSVLLLTTFLSAANAGLLKEDGNKGAKCIPLSACPDRHPSCPEGEEPSECGTLCERSCKNMNDGFDCEDVCVEGCFCEDGLVREDDNKGAKCIPLSACPDRHPSCPEGEEPSECGTLCERSCKNMNDGFDCEDVCVKGCFCENDLVREDGNKGAKCIPPSECPDRHPLCPEGEEHSECGTLCERSCENMNDDIGCPGVCVKGCFCENSLIREDDNKGAKCIPPSECPDRHPLCPEGEEHSECGTLCERSCENMNDDIGCPGVCVKGCFCEDGLIREDDNKGAKCIPPSECPDRHPLCPEGEEHSECGTLCERSCENMNDDIGCPGVCVKGCFCEDGLIREDDNKGAKCIPPSECPGFMRI